MAAFTQASPSPSPVIKRSDFPSDFKFGASTSALQTEGPPDIGGRGPSTWDSMITQGQEFNGLPSNQDVATLSYEKYREDVQLLKNIGFDVYRFSISWSRILPNERPDNVSGDNPSKWNVNKEGIAFYNNLINELIANGIEPFVTLFHYDLPSALQSEYNGFLDKKIVEDYTRFCDICFYYFGDRVKKWSTINEAEIVAAYGYVQELPIQNDPTTFPYIVAHNIILCHSAAARLYKEKYQGTQGGQIGLSLSVEWFEPYSASIVDKDASQRAFDFMVGWFVEPLVFGDYPFIMKSIVRDRLPSFTDDERKMVQGAYDFIAINYYTSSYAQGLPISPNDVPVSYQNDQYVEKKVTRDGKPIGTPVKGNPFVYVVPKGLRDILIFMKDNYNNPTIYITENGVSEPRNDSIPLKEALKDDHRIKFIQEHLHAVKEALDAGVDVKGYIVWALLDCMEVGSGYTARFGLYYTDYSTMELNRYPKRSAKWFAKFLKNVLMMHH